MLRLQLFNATGGFKFLLILSTILISLPISAQQFSKEDVLRDLHYLKTSLEETHFDLYAYTSKKEFEQNYSEVKKQIKNDSLNLLEVTKMFQMVVSRANNAHTRIPFPVEPYLEFANLGGSIFPLEVAIENNKAFIRKNWSDNNNIKIGAELKTINGIPINDVFKKIYPQISAERMYFKHAQLEMFTLPRYYWLVFGEQKTFEVEITHNGQHSKHKFDAIKAIENYEMVRDDIFKRDRDFKQLSTSVAYLQPGSFHGNEEEYKQFIDSAFVDFNTKQLKNLIIDLRNNDGGDDPFSDYLVSYIADKPFKWSSNFQLKSSAILKKDVRRTKDTTSAFRKSILKHQDGEIYAYDFGYYKPQPDEKRFQGKVYVLVNRQSYSQSTVTASQIQDYGFGQLVGEETGEFPNLYASIFSYELPITKITVIVSKGKIERISGIDNRKGVIPDIIFKDHLLDDKDEILEELLKIIIEN